MAKDTDISGLGLATPLAALLATTPQAVTATGTSSGTAKTLSSSPGLINLTTASSQTGAIFPTNMPLGAMYVVAVASSDSGVVYPPSGATINGGSSLTVAQNKTALFIRYSTTLIFSILTA